MDVARLDTHFTSKRVDDCLNCLESFPEDGVDMTPTSRAVRSNKTGTRLAFECIHDLLGYDSHEVAKIKSERETDANLICLRDALRNAHNEANLVLDSFDNCVGSRGWRHVENGSIRFCRLNRLANSYQPIMLDSAKYTHLSNSSENWQSQMGLASLLWRHSSNHVCTIRKCFGNVESTLDKS